MAVTVAAFMVFLLGTAALAVDMGNLLVARTELQNAADAAAMAGAGCLYKRTECNNTTATEPTWSDAQSTAASFAVPASSAPATNLVQNARLQVVSTTSGYWNVTGTPAGLQAPGTFTPGANDMPAVQVSIAKDGSNTNGGVLTILGGYFGFSVLKASAVATAVISRPGYVGKAGLFPIAIPQCMYNNYWNTSTNSPVTYQGTAIPGQTEPQTMGQPYVFDMMSTYHTDKCSQTAQWTSFNIQSAQSASATRDLITSGNQVPLGIGDQTWIQSGTKDTLFQATQACSDVPNGNGSCAYVTVAVVDSVANPGQNQTIEAFACLHIINEVGNGTNAHIVAQMSADQSKCQAANSGGVGPNYGAITPPRLVQ
ncbi:TadG family pilus assembly protein [Paraburkholderia sp. EG287A]|uniref:TadG family pilus assembly protein n=1 Tax=unclassified Paraburkholderia TaxID=2615204 RepID=UPI0034D1AF70